MKINHDPMRMSSGKLNSALQLVVSELPATTVLHEMASIPYNERSLTQYENKYIFYKIEHRCNKYQMDQCFEKGVGMLTREDGELILQRKYPLGGCINGSHVVGLVALPERDELAVTMPFIDAIFPFPSFKFGEEVYMAEPDSFLYINDDMTISSVSPKALRDMLREDRHNVSSLTLKGSTRPKKPKNGTLIYNKRSGKLEMYDSSEGWLELT